MSVKVIDAFRFVRAVSNTNTVLGSVEADADNDTLTLKAGSGIKLAVEPGTDTVTIEQQSVNELLSSALGRITIFADDSTLRVVQGGESFGILGTGAVSTTSNTEGDIAINVSTDLSTFDNTTSLFVAQGDNISLLTNDANYITNATASITAGQVSGLATVATTGVYGDLTTRPNITFTGDVTGGTGGQLSGGASSIAMTLANSGVAAGTYNGITVDAKGRVTGAVEHNYLTAETDTLDSVTTRGNNTTNEITVGKVNIGSVYSLPTFLGQEGEVLKVINGKLSFGEGGGTGIGDGAIYVAADDSSIKRIDAGETLSILGSGAVSTSSDIEGAITVNVSQDLSTFDNSTSQFIGAGTNVSLLTNDAGYLSAETDTFNTVTQRGAIASTPLTVSISATTGFTVATTQGNSLVGPLVELQRNRGINVQNLDYIGGVQFTGANSNNVLHDYGTIQYQIINKTLDSETSKAYIKTYSSGSEVNSLIVGNGYIESNENIKINNNNNLEFVGASYTTTLDKIEPTDNRTINLPNASGTLALQSELSAYTQQGTQHVGDLKGSVFADDSTVLVDAVAGKVPNSVESEQTVRLKTARPFQLVGAIAAGPINFDATGGVTLSTSFTNLNLSQFTNDVGFVTQGLQAGSPLSLFVNDVGYITAFSVAADDSTTRIINSGETIQFVGSGAVTTSSDDEGKITINVPTTISSFTNDSGYNTQNDVITLYGDITGSGRTSINTSLNLNLSNVAPGNYNYVEVDTRGIVQAGELRPYLQAGANISTLVNDAGYLTGVGSGLRFIGDDSTGFNVPAPGNDIRFAGTRGITISAANETVTIQGPFSNTGMLEGDIQGSVFGQDSTLLVDGLNSQVITSALSQDGAADGEVLAWSNALQSWHPVNLTSGGAVQYTDAQVDARIVANGKANWDTAYGWGNHATAGYFTTAALSTTSIHELFDVNTQTNPPANGNSLIWSSVRQQWEPGVVQPAALAFTDLTDTPANLASGPDQILVNNSTGTALEWLVLSTANIPESGNLYYNDGRVKTVLGAIDVALKPTTDYARDIGANETFQGAGDHKRFRNVYAQTFIGNLTGQASSISNHNTDALTEGSTNLYYTTARANTDFDTRLATKSTTDLAEGSNLYYTNARADARIAAANIGDLNNVDTTTNPPNNGQALGWNAVSQKWEPTTISGGGGGGGISLTDISVTSSGSVGTLSYNNSTGVITWTGISNTTNLPEGSNLYFTNARADTRADIRIAAADIQDLNNVSVVAPQTGQSLVWDGSNWSPLTIENDQFKFFVAGDDSTQRQVNADEVVKFIGISGISITTTTEGAVQIARDAIAIGDLSNVSSSAPSTGQVLKWSGTEWAPATDLTSSGGGGIALTDLSVTTAGTPLQLGALSYNNTSGVFTFTPPDIETNARAAISVGTANSPLQIGAISYNSTTGVLTYTPPDLSGYLQSYTETDPVVGAVNGIVKADGAGNISAAVAGTDYSTFDGAFGSLTGTPTTVAGYGITDAAPTASPTFTGTLTATTIEANTIQAPSSLTGTYSITSPTTITLDPVDEVLLDAPIRPISKTDAQLAGLVSSNGSIVANSDNNYKPSYYTGSTWRELNDVAMDVSTATHGDMLYYNGTQWVPVNSPVIRWNLGADPSSQYYTFDGPGFPTQAQDPTLYLHRGMTYIFSNNSGGSHPFQIRVSNGGAAYSTGVTNNGASSGDIVFEVPMDAPTTLYYQCTAHANMGATINVVA